MVNGAGYTSIEWKRIFPLRQALNGLAPSADESCDFVIKSLDFPIIDASMLSFDVVAIDCSMLHISAVQPAYFRYMFKLLQVTRGKVVQGTYRNRV